MIRCLHTASPLPRLRASALLALLAILLISSACNFPGPTTALPGTRVTNPTMSATDTPEIPLTPTPLPALTVLISPEGDPTGAELDPILAGLSAESGFRFEHLSALPPDLAGAKVNVAVIVSPIEGLSAVAASSPNIQFVAVGASGLSPSSNLTVVDPLSDRLDDLAFLGGYLTALVSQDWRVASLSAPEGVDGATTRIAFANGAEFLCGLCRTVRPPYPGFPVDYSSPPPGDTASLQSTLSQISGDDVEVAFLQLESDDPGLVSGLAEIGVRLIGVGNPGGDPSPAWIAAIEGDPGTAVEAIWSAVLAGESRGSMKMPLRVSTLDPTRLTPGRLLQFQSIMDELELGYISTGVDPLTGEPE